MSDIEENRTSSPMLVLSRQDNTADKEVTYVQGRTVTQYRSVYPLSSLGIGYEAFSHGPLFSVQDADRKRRWTSLHTVMQAILMAYEPSLALKDRFANARRTLVAMFPGRRRPGRTYQGFVRAMRRVASSFRQALADHLRRHHRRVAGEHWRLNGWVVFAADGSRVEAPRTAANEAALGCAGRKKTGPQLALTTLYHLGSGLPWDWRIGAGTESERTHLRSLLKTLPNDSLVVADAGFTGYDLFVGLLRQRLSFLVRVGANVTLLTGLAPAVKRQGNRVWLWPSSKRNQPPLCLRLIRLKVKSRYARKRRDVYLITNVLDATRLSPETAGKLYRLRWGVEVFYRSFKRTLDQHTLRSRHPRQARDELHWAMTAMLLLGLMSVEALSRQRISPSRLSPASALRMVRHSMHPDQPWRHRGDLRVVLNRAVTDVYSRRRPKTARNWPHKKNDPPPGVPKIRKANPNEIACAKKSYHAA